MKQDLFYLFVYGSLRSGFHHPAYQYISEYFHFEGEARTKGLLYDMGEYPAAIHTAEEKFIIGELYKIKNEDEFTWAMAQLDDYEGVVIEEGETPLYHRDKTLVWINEREQEAWIYWFNGDISGSAIIEEGDVLEYWKRKNKPT
ncbi:MAG: gamma-glutamylcyclotransferase [Chitinophagaceae bacterium]|jgi:gamma-glutamylcyclotransferase (GGCT)/AIG2-like uncharacterized protein YtfP|nr:gamma-glutamylcyclotransferase [Chitinophagaceae bacterium]